MRGGNYLYVGEGMVECVVRRYGEVDVEEGGTLDRKAVCLGCRYDFIMIRKIAVTNYLADCV